MECQCGNKDRSAFIGHELRGVYDGVLVWQCMKCGFAFPRRDDECRRSDAGREYAAILNRRQA